MALPTTFGVATILYEVTQAVGALNRADDALDEERLESVERQLLLIHEALSRIHAVAEEMGR